MKKEDISDAINMLDEDIIEETGALRRKKRAGGKNILKWVCAAACVAIAVYAGAKILPQKAPVAEPENLPLLSVSESGGTAMGFEGYLAFDVSELVNANPWNEASELSTLPVYKNKLTYSEYFIAEGADFDKMRELLLETAGRLGLDTGELTITDDSLDEETQKQITEKFGNSVPEGYFDPTKLIAETEGIKIEVDQALTVEISFDPAKALPEEYNFSHFAPYEDVAAVAEYLKTAYSDVIGASDPQTNIYGGDYTFSGEQGYYIEFFEAGETEVETIVNYNFNRTAFYCDDEKKLFIIRIYGTNLSEKVGDYPIITTEEAKALLLNGNYITSVSYEMPGEEYIKKVELVYRTGEQAEYYMPYYRFYVELPEEAQENGLKTYGAYYVPAVEGEYISDMPLWDGSFN